MENTRSHVSMDTTQIITLLSSFISYSKTNVGYLAEKVLEYLRNGEKTDVVTEWCQIVS